MAHLYYRIHSAFWNGVRQLCLGGLRFGFARPMVVDRGRVLIFSPHQDDETLGCGGLIALKRRRGANVHVAFLTDGSRGCGDDSPWTAEQLSEIRRGEAVAALDLLGVPASNLTFLGAPDGALDALGPDQEQSLLLALERLLQSLQPDEVLLPFHGDRHPDHKAAHRLVLESLKRSGVSPLVHQYPVWALETPWRSGLRWPELKGARYLKIDKVVSLKRQALGEYRSQVEPQPPHGRLGLPSSLLALFLKDYELYFPGGEP